MSYQVLARKWRPSTFTEMVGQEHVLKALVNALDSGRLHHAYLFTGTRGVGKTSIARLFAKALNCEEGVSAEPCGQCAACKSIAEGRFVDLIEVDAASRTKVEDTRELLENVQYAPTQGRYKVYLIDEVHMLSSHSFNALLKTLEEPPPHIKFLLATTDPQKLPVTILSRCLQFNLKNMSPERIVEHLQHVLKEEQVGFDDPSLWLLGRAANGSMRDAMSLTDQAISFGNGAIKEDDVRAMLGSVDHQQVLKLLQHIANRQPQEVMSAVADMAEYGVDYDDVLAELISVLHRIAIGQMLPASIDNSLGDQTQVLAIASALKAEDVQLFYQIALNGRKDLPMVPVPREGLEMTLLRMMAFRPVMPGETVSAVPVAELSNNVSGSTTSVSSSVAPVTPVTDVEQSDVGAATPQREEAQSESDLKPETTSVAEASSESELSDSLKGNRAVPDLIKPSMPDREPVPEQQSVPEQKITEEYSAGEESHQVENSIPKPPISDDPPPWGLTEASPPEPSAPPGDFAKKPESPEEEPVVGAADSGEVPSKPEPVEVTETAKPVELAEPSEAATIDFYGLNAGTWIQVIDAIGISGMTYNIAANMSVTDVSSDQVSFVIASDQRHLMNDVHQQRIESSLSGYFGAEISIRVTEGTTNSETPAQYQYRRQQERLAEAHRAIESDENVQQLIERYGARVNKESVKPLG